MKPLMMQGVWIMILFLWFTNSVNGDNAKPPVLPFHESFQNNALAAAWTKIVSPEAGSLDINEGWMKIDSFENSQAHIMRNLGIDNVTISAKIKWVGSINLYWDRNNWCSVGKIAPTPFGRFTSTLTSGGKSSEMDHRGCFVDFPHLVRIQIGKNCIRFEHSFDGSNWIFLRTEKRPSGFKGAPQILFAGKYYSPDQSDFLTSKTISLKGDQGKKYGGWITDIRIDKTPEKDWAISETEREKMELLPQSDPFGNRILQGDGDPVYDKVAEYYPPMKYPREVVGVPEHALDIGVNYLGQLDVSPWEAPRGWFEIGDPPVPFGIENTPISRRLLDGYLPILTIKTDHNNMELEMTVFGWSEGFATDKDLFAYIKLEAKAKNNSEPPKQCELVFDNANKRSKWNMKSGKPKTSCVYLSIKYPDLSSCSIVESETFEKNLKETAEHWRLKIKDAERFDLPDQRVNEAYRAWICYSLLNSDMINGYLEPHDGAGFYEDIFGYSVSLHAMMLEMYGMHDQAEKCLKTLLHFQQPDGLYTQNAGLPDHGSMLVAIAAHYDYTHKDEWLKSVAPQVVKACDWIVKQRESAPKDGLTKGMIKFRPYCDYPDAVYNYIGDTYCCLGLEKSADVLKVIGMNEEAERFDKEAVQYRKDLLDSMKNSLFQDGELSILPLEPETRRLLNMSKFRGGDYYGLTASILLEHEFLAADSAPASAIIDMLEKRKGLILGVCEFMEGIDHAYTYGYLLNMLKRDDIRKVLLGFWGMLAHGMTRDTYSPVEVSMIATGENHLTLPHLYSCTQQLALLRNMLLREDGDTLFITQAVPRSWLEPGKTISVKSAPTLFGSVSYQINAESDEGIFVRLDPPTSNPPNEIRLRLRHPRLFEIKGVLTNPSVDVEFSQETIIMRNLDSSVDIRVAFGAR